MTIGLEYAPNGGGEVDVSSLQSDSQPFLQNFVAGSPLDGEGFVVDDELGGAWYLLAGASNGYAGDDLKVLVMQVTTAGVPSGKLNAQVIPASGDSDALQVQQGFEGTEVWDLLPPVVFPGCTDPLACNYDADATEDDGSCEYGCGGCTDVSACNYNPNALYDDGSCDFLACAGCTDLEACNFDAWATADDGSCEFTSCAGCTDLDADNYDPTATLDDGNCIFLGCQNPLACNLIPLPTKTMVAASSQVASGESVCVQLDPTLTVYDPAVPKRDMPAMELCLNDADADGVCEI